MEDVVQIALDLVESFIDWASESDNLESLARSLGDAVAFLAKMTMGAVEWVNNLVQGYRDAVQWFQDFSNKIYELGDNATEWVMEFFGTGSDKKYLSEKIKELEFKITDFTSMVDAQKPTLTVDASGVSDAVEEATQQVRTFTRMAMQPKTSVEEWNDRIAEGGGSSWTGPKTIRRNYDFWDPDFWQKKMDEYKVIAEQDRLMNKQLISTNMGLANSVHRQTLESMRQTVEQSKLAQEMARWNSYSDAWQSRGPSQVIIQPAYMTADRQGAAQAAQAITREQSYYERRTG